MLAVPPVPPVTMPEVLPILATEELSLVQVPPKFASDNPAGTPEQNVPGPDIEAKESVVLDVVVAVFELTQPLFVAVAV